MRITGKWEDQVTLTVESLYKLHSMVNMNNEQWGEFFGLQKLGQKLKLAQHHGKG